MRFAAIAAAWVLAACQYITAPGNSAPADQPEELRSFVELVNRHRVSVGCGALVWDGGVAQVAQAHSDDMARNNYFAHTNQQGLSPFDRLRAGGVTYRSAAENIAYGQSTGQQVLQSWLNSPGHRTNIENCNYTKHGVGLVQTRWTHVFIGDR